MSAIKWARPSSVADAVQLLQDEPGARLHGGGTGLLRQRFLTGTLVDLSETGLSELSGSGDAYSIGAGATFTDVIEAVRAVDPDHVLVTALGQVAAPALRNRITVGGSLGMLPPWSGLLGPLVALGAQVTVAGVDGSTAPTRVPIETFVRERTYHHRTVVTQVDVPRASGKAAWWYRFVRVHFDYAAFSLTVVGEPIAGALSQARIVVVGTTNRFDRLERLETRLVAPGGLAAFAAADARIAPEDFPVTIPARNGFSSEYLTEMARVRLERGFRELAGRDE